MRPSVAIIGAGVSGLGIGWRLAAAGCAVDLFDKGTAGRGSSWAAAGMLAAGAECEPGEERLLELTMLSQRMWPEFRAQVEAASGMAVGYRDEGTMAIALTRDDVARLRFDHEFRTGLGIDLHWLSGREATLREPHLSPETVAAVYSPRDHQVGNRRLTDAMKSAYLASGGRLHENRAVHGVDVSGGWAAGVLLEDGRHQADVTILAAGPWSHGIDGIPPEATPPVRPVKGQMLSLAMDPAAPLLRHVVWAGDAYFVPRDDGRLIVGATVEEKGFDDRITAGGVFALLEAAWRAIPNVEELAIAETWVGFRPTSRDDAPILGPTPVEGLLLATGHHRNGILLAPATAQIVSEYVLTGRLVPEARDFTVARFLNTPRSAAPIAAAGG